MNYMSYLQDNSDVRLDHYLQALTPAGRPDDSIYELTDVVSFFNSIHYLALINGMMSLLTPEQQQHRYDDQGGISLQLRTRESSNHPAIHKCKQGNEVVKTPGTKQSKRFRRGK